MPFTGLSDVGSKIADLYSQEVNLLKLGRMPALFVIDRDGRVVYSHHGSSMSDIPSNEEVLGVLRGLSQV
jgi:peroxiredoxin Q/BCP